MAKLRLKFLDKDEEDLVHSQSIRSLETIGVKIHSDSVLNMLKDAGAVVDIKTQIAKIPESMVKDAISKAPKSFTIGSRDGKHDIKLPAETWPYVSLGGVTAWLEDYKTMKHLDATREDLGRLTKIGDAMNAVDAIWPLVTVRDVPPHAGFVNELWTSFKNTTKPIHGSAGSGTVGVPDAKVQIQLGALIAGGMEQLKKKPTFTVLSCIVAPLSFEKGCVEAQVEYAKAGIPVISMSMSLGGSTCPATIAGTVVNANTENLASLVITQTASPGAPHIYSSESSLINPRTGFIEYRSAETPLIYAACAQMASRYGLPNMTGCMGIDAFPTGNPTTFGETAAMLMTTLNGTDLCSGVGGLDEDAGCSAEQIVIDSFIWEDFRMFMRKFEISEKQAALDVMAEVGQGNNFLTHKHTVTNFRKEIYFRDKKMQLYGATVSTKMREDAHKIVEKILREHVVPELDKDILQKGAEIIKNYEKNPPAHL
ncbi:MAG: trimethylamine methyltransferase family protein [Thermoplasmata archaeon]|nr:trimethylamine methyltransferase family protein [Thermoplasmata archaeon]